MVTVAESITIVNDWEKRRWITPVWCDRREPRGESAVDHLHAVGIVAVAGHGADGHGAVDPREVLGGQVDIEGPEGLAQAIAPAGADQGDDIATFRQHPGDGELRGRGTLLGRDGV